MNELIKNKSKNNTYIYVQITSGKGPEECQYVVAKVLALFMEELRNKDISVELIHRIEGFDHATLQSATLKIKEDNSYLWKEKWIGTIQWIEKSPYRKLNKRKNWYIGIFEVKDFVLVELNEKDIEFKTMRSSGAGGQHVNKVSSAVRAIHQPTGVSVVCQDSRSQHQNKKIAIERLKIKLNEENMSQLRNQITEKWENHSQLERGNPIQTFIGGQLKLKKEDKKYKKKRNEFKRELQKKNRMKLIEKKTYKNESLFYKSLG